MRGKKHYENNSTKNTHRPKNTSCDFWMDVFCIYIGCIGRNCEYFISKEKTNAYNDYR